MTFSGGFSCRCAAGNEYGVAYQIRKPPYLLPECSLRYRAGRAPLIYSRPNGRSQMVSSTSIQKKEYYSSSLYSESTAMPRIMGDQSVQRSNPDDKDFSNSPNRRWSIIVSFGLTFTSAASNLKLSTPVQLGCLKTFRMARVCLRRRGAAHCPTVALTMFHHIRLILLSNGFICEKQWAAERIHCAFSNEPPHTQTRFATGARK